MSQSVSVLVVFARKALGVVFAGLNGAFLRPFGLVCQHVRFQILEDSAAFWNWALSFLPSFVIKFKAWAPLT